MATQTEVKNKMVVGAVYYLEKLNECFFDFTVEERAVLDKTLKIVKRRYD